MFCSNCGARIEPSENFCRDCGQRAVPRDNRSSKSAQREGQPTLVLPETETNQTTPQYGSTGAGTNPVTQVPPLSYTPSDTRKSSKGFLIAIFCLLLLLLVGLPAGLWYWWRQSSALNAGASDVVLRLQGSNTIGSSLAPALVEEFLKKRGARDIKRIPGKAADELTVQAILPGDSTPKSIEIKAHGSDTAFTGLAKGEADIGMASRKIKPEEIQQLASLGDMTSRASERVLALDGIAIIVNNNNDVAKLTKDQIAKIFTGEIKDWTEVSGQSGAINIYARDDKSGTFDTFKSLVLGKDNKLVASAKRFEDSNELSRSVANDKNGIGFVGLPFIGNAKAVAVSESGATPLKPSRFTVATEDYLLTRRLYFYVPPVPKSPLALEFINFALSAEGQAIVEDQKFISLTVKGEKPVASRDAPSEYQDVTRGAERLSLNFRFRPGKKELDNKALSDIELVVELLGKNKNQNQKVLLLGFTDNTGDAQKNVQLSKDRAEVVADEFRQRGVTPSVVTGFGAQMPVASNDTKDGQEKNRRVEIWLKP